MSILIRETHNGHVIYHPINGTDSTAIEPGGSVLDPQIGTLDPMPNAVILSDDAGHASAAPDDDAGSWLRSWSQSGWEQFDDAFRNAREQIQSKDASLVIRPSISGMLSDAVCTLNWCTRGGGQNARLLLDPMGWIVPSMMRDLEDHLDRIVELCTEMIAHQRVWGIVVRSIVWNEDRSGLKSAALGSGDADPDMILEKLRPLLGSGAYIIAIDPSDIPRIQPAASIEP